MPRAGFLTVTQASAQMPAQAIWRATTVPCNADLRTGPSLFPAVQEQLGSKLEVGKGRVEVLVIDQ